MDEIEGEIILDDSEELQDEVVEDVFTPDENILFEEIETGDLIEENTPIVDDVDDYIDTLENITDGDIGNDIETYNEIRNLQNDLESQVIEGGGSEDSIDNEILESLQITQQNIKTGFDNLSLLGTVEVGLTAFGIGAIIIYCYIGRFR